MEARSRLGGGVAIGVAIGAALGIVMDNLAVGMGAGIAIGVALGLAMDESRKRKGGSEHGGSTPAGRDQGTDADGGGD